MLSRLQDRDKDYRPIRELHVERWHRRRMAAEEQLQRRLSLDVARQEARSERWNRKVMAIEDH